ncbi:hypothetical protein QJS04_geneDACA003363 [Acorus gramineus]|uniref:Serine hydroxymethyltransferase-like domain-containing protein n=1 Tax=Acorus gramineus TaxID=55184 RepID=A0AAV9BJP8_ACOGR|nr:hypothetical protein QJS04_geneDACA003363 [Acorus gramineus]
MVAEIIELEKPRQWKGLQLIPSENFTSVSVMQAVGSVMANKYSEGYPGVRYHCGNEHCAKFLQNRIKIFGGKTGNLDHSITVIRDKKKNTNDKGKENGFNDEALTVFSRAEEGGFGVELIGE